MTISQAQLWRSLRSHVFLKCTADQVIFIGLQAQVLYFLSWLMAVFMESFSSSCICQAYFINISDSIFNEQWRSQGRVPGVPEPPLRDIAIANSREKILLEPASESQDLLL